MKFTIDLPCCLQKNRMIQSNKRKYCGEHLIKTAIAFNIKIILGKNLHFKVLTFPIHECGMFIYLFRAASSLNFFPF